MTRTSTRSGSSISTTSSSLSDLSDLDLAAAAFCVPDLPSDDEEEEELEVLTNQIGLKGVSFDYAQQNWFDDLLHRFSDSRSSR